MSLDIFCGVLLLYMKSKNMALTLRMAQGGGVITVATCTAFEMILLCASCLLPLNERCLVECAATFFSILFITASQDDLVVSPISA